MRYLTSKSRKMSKFTGKLSVILLVGCFFIFPRTVQAVIPPDFVFNIGTQVAQFFSMMILLLTGLLGTSLQFFKANLYSLRYKKILISLAFLSIVLVSFGISYIYAVHRQKTEYAEWVAESEKYGAGNDSDGLNEEFGVLEFSEEIEPAVSASVSADGENSTPDFFTANSGKNIMITNQEFRDSILSGKNDYLVLDAREDVEYENGYFPGSLHIRFADLMAGRWAELPTDKFIYVICWSGIRGKEVADFLRTKAIVASYLENGADGWVEYGGEWIGGIKFLARYTDPRYQLVFSTEETRKMVQEGVVLVDTREPARFQKSHIAGSVNIPIMYTPSAELETAFGQVPAGSRVITVCDGYVNCVDAKITGVELERRGHQFLGRFNKPWEYGK